MPKLEHGGQIGELGCSFSVKKGFAEFHPNPRKKKVLQIRRHKVLIVPEQP